ncbi:MAG: hypothetical protein ACFNUL_03320 [Cardiobacterium hominis]
MFISLKIRGLGSLLSGSLKRGMGYLKSACVPRPSCLCRLRLLKAKGAIFAGIGFCILVVLAGFRNPISSAREIASRFFYRKFGRRKSTIMGFLFCLPH